MGHRNLIGEVKSGVYSLSGLGQMHRVWGLHKRLSGEVLRDVRWQEFAVSVVILY